MHGIRAVIGNVGGRNLPFLRGGMRLRLVTARTSAARRGPDYHAPGNQHRSGACQFAIRPQRRRQIFWRNSNLHQYLAAGSVHCVADFLRHQRSTSEAYFCFRKYDSGSRS